MNDLLKNIVKNLTILVCGDATQSPVTRIEDNLMIHKLFSRAAPFQKWAFRLNSKVAPEV